MSNIPEIFGSLLFNETVMKERLPKDTYKAMKKSIEEGRPIAHEISDVVANCMKDWALEHGATHYTHWFQPMTGITAEKHDSFITPTAEGGVIMEFSGTALVRGEPDASSFPSGGLRATFEARGYTAWDPSSPSFIKDGTLCIPTAFCSYGGEALDKKTPLLRSMETLNRQALRILRLFGDEDTKRVTSTVGPEQEYFLIDADVFEKRRDLVFCGRTLFGAKPPKGQELEDHYFGIIKPRVSAFMKELDEELWKLGVLAKTKHNEVAPSQHELAPIFTTCNIAADDNQITMEIMKRVAAKHNLVCLLHEKPFAGVNGSGKHNNWSVTTSSGLNLLEPGDSPRENAQFLLVLTALIKAVDDYQDLLRISVASAGNDHRLGANEAPPAIVSIFLGDELTAVLDAIKNECHYANHECIEMEIGVDILPRFPKDSTDRNRTSPLAFTGNKFELRMLGSAASISDCNVVLNTIVAESFSQFADALEGAEDFQSALSDLIRNTIIEHERILFNGNNYAEEWVREAAFRGLLNLNTTADALPYYISEKNIRLFTAHRVFSESEIYSRYEISLENYCKTISIEALTMLDMAKKDILPAVLRYTGDLTRIALDKAALFANLPDTGMTVDTESKMISRLSALAACLHTAIEKLDAAHLDLKVQEHALAQANHCRDIVIPAMQELRAVADELEMLVASGYWPFPTYSTLMFSV